MRRAALALTTLLLAAAPGPALADQERLERFTGTARGPDGAVRYLEEHAVWRTPDRLLSATTTYLDPDGRILAELETDFSRDPYAPSYRFRDLRSGEAESVEVSPSGLRLEAGRDRRALPAPAGAGAPLVTGQGLDRLVQARLDDLAAGQVLTVAYAIPSRLDTFRFRVRALSPRAEDPVLRVRIEVSSLLLRLLAPSLDVDYDRSTRHLLRYRGVSNLAGERGERQDVEISYAYPDVAPTGLETARVP